MPGYFRTSWKTHSGMNHQRVEKCACLLRQLSCWPNLFDLPGQGFLVILNACPAFLPQYFIYSCILGLISCSVFLRVNYELKMLIMMLALVGYNTILLHTHAHVLDAYSQVLFQRWVCPLCLFFSSSFMAMLILWSYVQWKLSKLPLSIITVSFFEMKVQGYEVCFHYS